LRYGSWAAAFALFVYASAFSYAYLRIVAGVGALLLFGAVQVTMLAAALRGGERPHLGEWAGWALAVGGLVALVAPGLSAPDPLGAALMLVAGVAWGVYSLLGRGTERPALATMGNFLRTVPLAFVLVAADRTTVRASGGGLPSSDWGLVAAIASGVVASGLGYSLWYAAVPHLGAARAAVVQLSVPALTALAAVVVLGEPLTTRLIGCACAILGGVALALVTRES
jgi:drug/metabolite transporter (DMT)-like permease